MLGFLSLHFSQLPHIVHGIHVSFLHFKGSSEGVSRSRCIGLHFAFHILVAWCSSFTIMRFPLRVVAITRVEAGYGNREGGMCLVLFMLFLSPSHHIWGMFCFVLSFPSGVT